MFPFCRFWIFVLCFEEWDWAGYSDEQHMNERDKKSRIVFSNLHVLLWWFVELSYWFTAGFSLTILGIFTTRDAKDNITWDRLSTYEIRLNVKHRKLGGMGLARRSEKSNGGLQERIRGGKKLYGWQRNFWGGKNISVSGPKTFRMANYFFLGWQKNFGGKKNLDSGYLPKKFTIRKNYSATSTILFHLKKICDFQDSTCHLEKKILPLSKCVQESNMHSSEEPSTKHKPSLFVTFALLEGWFTERNESKWLIFVYHVCLL